MKLRDLPLVAETGVEYVRYRLNTKRSFQRVMSGSSGRRVLTPPEAEMARRATYGLTRLGVRCLARSVVVATMLRRRGIAAAVSLSIERTRSSRRPAHAEVAVGGIALRAHPDGNVLLQ